MNNLIVFGGIVVAIIAAFVWEDSREFMVEGFEYIISFEWWSDLWDLFGSAFEDIGNISFIGLAFGLISFGIIYGFRNQMLNPFLIHMGTGEAILWGGATYIGSFVGAYLLGKGMENS